ncbi:hypothetical protein M407DRAFT_24739 [Tulasnella calospora MUT 4182]|uniref:F-box domain-containing protein n=1 Tax=Tulasnella calospora MUT 4182 TaxID=1051891 RepID=A0A0C3KX24_9AGAM|nr:hypothetical protein M407DRAFT_24739 [Tulasnella calospora MUT 4182]
MDLRLRNMTDFKVLFDSSVHRDVVKHVRHRNALLPIGKLPAELLQIVFSNCLFSSSGRRKSHFVSRLTTLRAVSWSWQDFIGRTPSFWAHVSSEDHMDFVSVAFERSGQVPIHLKHIGNHQDGQESLFLDRVLLHVHRWESLAIHQPNVNVAIQFLSVSAPKIKSILLSSLTNGSLHQRHVDSLFGGGLANLEELRVYFWGDIGWRGLKCTRLRILDIEREYSLDLGAVLNILAANPCLESLRIHDISFVHYPQPDLILAPIPLDHLKELTLTDVKYATENAFIGSNVAIGDLLQRIKFLRWSIWPVSLG